MNATKIQIKKAQLEVLQDVYDFLKDKLQCSPFTDYKIVGKAEKQSTDWRTGELLWEDDEHTIPKYENKWESVPIPESEYTDEMRARKAAIEKLMNDLDGMV